MTRGRELARFFRGASTLGLASVLAQGLAFALTPVLARLYSPDAFGFLGLIVSVSGIVSMVLTLRLGVAVVAAESREDARRLLLTTVVFASLIAGLIALALAASMQWAWIFVAPIAWMMGLLRVVTSWLSRHGRVVQLSMLTMGRGLAQSGSQLAFGLVGMHAIGLPLGVIVGGTVFAAAALAHATRLVREQRSEGGGLVNVAPVRLLRRYRTFPQYSLPQGLMSEASQATAILFFSSAYGLQAAGYYTAALRLSQLPVHLASQSIQQTLYGTRSGSMNYSPELRSRFAGQLVVLIASISLPAFLLVGWFAPQLVTLVLGPEWGPTAPVLRWILLWQYVELAASPAIALYRMHARERAHFVQAAGHFVSGLAVVAIALFSQADMTSAVAMFAIAGAFWKAAMIVTAFAGRRRMSIDP